MQIKLEKILKNGNIFIVSNDLSKSDILNECIQIHKKNHKNLFVIENTCQYSIDDVENLKRLNKHPCKWE